MLGNYQVIFQPPIKDRHISITIYFYTGCNYIRPHRSCIFLLETYLEALPVCILTGIY